MSEIVSCAKDTQLHSFPGLEQLASSAHVVSDGSYCHFLGSSKLFVRANKDWGIELLRIKPGTDQQPDGAGKTGSCGSRTIANVKKIMIDNLYCVACPKTAGKEEIAIGLTTGTVRFMNYKKANFTKRFDADRIAIGVTFMDFNATDDFLAAVFENGLVNVYGMKSNSKLHTLAFDKNTVKARFHPTKRFSMAIASYNGAVLLYDTQSKKTIFSQTTAHAAPCRDVGMVESYPDYLFSVGYDNVINIFDTRRKATASQIQSNYPFESLAIAEDGIHLAVGNLKGYVYGYDLRNLKDPLNMQKIHQSCVNSISFVPQPREGSNRRSMIELDESKKVTKKQTSRRPDRLTVNDPQTPLGAVEQHDSFIGEIDLFLQRRDAPMDCLSRLSTSSRLSTDSRNSMQMAGNNLMGFLEELSDCNIDPEATESQTQPAAESNSGVDDSFVNVNRLLRRVKGDVSKRKAHGVGDNLEYIREEGSELGDGANEVLASSNNQPAATPRILAESQQGNTFTPLGEGKKSNVPADESEQIAEVKSDKENRTRLSTLKPEVYTSTPEASTVLLSTIAELRKAMMEKFEQCTLRQLDAEQAMQSHLWMCMYNLWRETQSKLESLEQYVSTGLGLLLPRDEFAQQFLSMRAENESLRARLKQLEEGGKHG
ncbi:AGAP007817-PA [Anopheles gambiae str. PEST]|uniref:AGAP007817-PA n=1 Tax=Anopheles gambiae TaxID=7165 RepID=Q7Q3D1_ANOGA|nr:AGAP007817-PA [Anopheles gambiae str. PEST]